MCSDPTTQAAAESAANRESMLPPSASRPKKPRITHSINQSPLRPHVLASDRLRDWTTPYGLQFRAMLSKTTSPESARRVVDTMLASLEESSRKNYGAGLLRFTQFCDIMSVPEDARMPAPDHLLASFIANWSGVVSSRSTVDTWIAGISFWHAINGAPWQGGKLLKVTCAGALKLQPNTKPKRAPVTIEHVSALSHALDLTDSFDAAVFAVACVAFWGCRR